LTANKLIPLAEIYIIPADQLIRYIYAGGAQPLILDQPSRPDATKSLTEDSRESQTKRTLPFPRNPDQPPDQTTLLPVENRQSRTPFSTAIIGKLDETLAD
jgi:hypothetical protein